MKQSQFLTSLKNNKIIWIVVFVVIVLVGVVVFVENVLRNSYLNILVTPASAEITINGDSISNGARKLFPGEYEIVIKKDGFITKTMKVNVSPDYYTNYFDYLVDENEDYSYYEMSENSDDYSLLEQVAEYNDGAKNYFIEVSKIEEIYNKLPFAVRGDDFQYSIEEADDCDKRFCLRIRNFEKNNYERAKDKIREMGFNPDKYQILNVDGAGYEMSE